MAVFPNYQPLISGAKRNAPRVRSTRFNDGYEKRISFGLNQNPKILNLTFNLDEEGTTEVETFINDRIDDGDAFDWSPPDSTSTFKWVARSYSKEMFQPGRNKISTTFEQVFE